MTQTLETAVSLRACVFKLGGEAFALDVRSVREVVMFDDYTNVPRASSDVVGVANLRGDVVPIVDARMLLGLPVERRGRAVEGLVIAAGSFQIALLIDAVLGLDSFDAVTPFGDAARKRYGPWGVGLLSRGEEFITLLEARELVEALRGGVRQRTRFEPDRPAAIGAGDA